MITENHFMLNTPKGVIKKYILLMRYKAPANTIGADQYPPPPNGGVMVYPQRERKVLELNGVFFSQNVVVYIPSPTQDAW